MIPQENAKTATMLALLPNAVTLLRLLLALPVGYLILQGQFGTALLVGLLAGVTDALDGLLARRLNADSRFGAALDPIADKVLVTTVFLSMAMVGLVPWLITATVVLRDLVIVLGASCYHWLIGELELQPTALSKSNMAIQIGYCVLVLAAALLPRLPGELVQAGGALVLLVTVASGIDYVITWTGRARANRGRQGGDRHRGKD
ncbi:CDP-alcohol phosphatidyltransferase family protein [Halieaceae bacterium]|nr:CDP-alcohol phosphatidyltransferase family protein [Halieaceae bacterium]